MKFSTDWFTDKIATFKKYMPDMLTRHNLVLLEIGSYEGRSAVWFAENYMKGDESSLVCIDKFSDPLIESNFDKNISELSSHVEILKLKGASQEVLRQFNPNSFDFIYIDADHTAKATLLNIALSWDLLRSGGYLVFDDYEWNPVNDYWKTPKPAIEAYLDIFRDSITLVYKGYCVITRKK